MRYPLPFDEASATGRSTPCRSWLSARCSPCYRTFHLIWKIQEMIMSDKRQANSLLGYPADARLLIINADDFGMCHAVNEASLRALKEGLASSCTLMTPCPWALHALKLLQDSPEIPFGVHLTSVSEQPYYRWGPLTCGEEVPTVVDEAGYFYNETRIDEFLGQINLAELGREYRAQIERVLETGLQPTHLDGHCGIHTRRE